MSMRRLATLATVATLVAGCSSDAASTIEPGTPAQDTLTSARTDQVAPTNSVNASATLTPTQSLRCDADLDQIVELLQSGQFPSDFQPAADLDDLVQQSELVLTGTLDSFVRETSARGPTGEQIVLHSSDSKVLTTDSTDQPEVLSFSMATAWAPRPEPDLLAEPVLVDDVSFVAFLRRSTDDPNAFVVGPQSLQIACTGSDGPTISITAPPPTDASGLSLDELVTAVD